MALVAIVFMTVAAMILLIMALVVIMLINFISLYLLNIALCSLKKLQSERLDKHFNKITDSYYKDDEKTSIHVPISFFISNVSTVAFFVVAVLFIGQNQDFFTDNIPYVGILLYCIILIVMISIVIHEFSISFGRLAWTIGKRTEGSGIAFALIIWMFFIFIIAISVAIILSKYWV